MTSILGGGYAEIPRQSLTQLRVAAPQSHTGKATAPDWICGHHDSLEATRSSHFLQEDITQERKDVEDGLTGDFKGTIHVAQPVTQQQHNILS